MIKDFTTYINEGLFDRNQSEFTIRKTDNGVEQVYVPKTKEELYSYIDIDIEQAKKKGSYPNVDLNNIDVSKLENIDELKGLFSKTYNQINPDISNWNIKSIPSNFFDGNKQIKEFSIPNGVTNIRSWAFYDCDSLTSVIIPNGVTRIESGAFCGCIILTSVIIPNGVTRIEDFTFNICEALSSVTIPNSVRSIGNASFCDCIILTSVMIPNSVTSIGDNAFQGCSKLASVTIPNSVRSIGYKAFDGCGSLTYVTISKHCNIELISFPKNCKIIRRDD